MCALIAGGVATAAAGEPTGIYTLHGVRDLLNCTQVRQTKQAGERS